MKLRDLGLTATLLVALVPRPAQAQGDFVKGQLTQLIKKAGIYVSTSKKTATDNDVDITNKIGISPGLAGRLRTGKKYPFSISGYSADLETNGAGFARFKALQIISGIGYEWAPSNKFIYGAQLGVGYSFNKLDMNAAAPEMFNTAGPVQIDVSNSWVLRPQLKAEYFVVPKVSVRLQGGYLLTNPHVTVQTPTARYERDWRPSNYYVSLAMGFFPLRK
jgi:hypothetical protein